MSNRAPHKSLYDLNKDELIYLISVIDDPNRLSDKELEDKAEIFNQLIIERKCKKLTLLFIEAVFKMADDETIETLEIDNEELITAAETKAFINKYREPIKKLEVIGYNNSMKTLKFALNGKTCNEWRMTDEIRADPDKIFLFEFNYSDLVVYMGQKLLARC